MKRRALAILILLATPGFPWLFRQLDWILTVLEMPGGVLKWHDTISTQIVGGLSVVDGISIGIAIILALLTAWLFLPDIQKRLYEIRRKQVDLRVFLQPWENSWYLGVQNVSDSPNELMVRVQIVACRPITPLLPITLRVREDGSPAVSLPHHATELFEFLHCRSSEAGEASVLELPGFTCPLNVVPNGQMEITVRIFPEGAPFVEETFAFRKSEAGIRASEAAHAVHQEAKAEPTHSRETHHQESETCAPLSVPLNLLGRRFIIETISGLQVETGETETNARRSYGAGGKKEVVRSARDIWVKADDGREIKITLYNVRPPTRDGSRITLLFAEEISKNLAIFYSVYNHSTGHWSTLTEQAELVKYFVNTRYLRWEAFALLFGYIAFMFLMQLNLMYKITSPWITLAVLLSVIFFKPALDRIRAKRLFLALDGIEGGLSDGRALSHFKEAESHRIPSP